MPGTYESPVEDILYNLASWIKAGIAAYLTGIMAVKAADPVTLATPKDVQVSDADPWGQTEYPMILIYPTEAPVESDADSGHDELSVTAEIMIAISEGDPISGTKRILRTTEAVREMIRDDRSMGGNANMISTRGIAYYPGDPESPAVRIATITTQIKKLLSRD